jgi:hypothetical protein
MSTVTVQLSRPIEVDGKQVTSLTFREATVGDACRADLVEGDFQKMAAIMSGMAGISLPAMQQIPLREFNQIAQKVAALMGEAEAAA